MTYAALIALAGVAAASVALLLTRPGSTSKTPITRYTDKRLARMLARLSGFGRTRA